MEKTTPMRMTAPRTSLTTLKLVTAAVAMLGLSLVVGCSTDDGGAASADGAALSPDVVEAASAEADAQGWASDASAESGQDAEDELADTSEGEELLGDLSQAEGVGETQEVAEVHADATDVQDLGGDVAACGIQLQFQLEDYELLSFGDIEIVVDVIGATTVELRYRVAIDEQPLSSVAMTPESPDEPGSDTRWRATIPGDIQTIAGLDYMIVAENDECSVFEPKADAAYEAPGMLYHIALYGELPLAVDPYAYLYAPSVHDGRVVWATSEGTLPDDDVVLLDATSGELQTITDAARSQGPARVHGDYVAWVDRRHVVNEWDPNSEIYLADLTSGVELRVTNNFEGQYGLSLHGRMLVWRDDRHMADEGVQGINGDIYGYDMGPDGRFGSPDDGGELRLTSELSDQTAPSVWSGRDPGDEDGATDRVRVVWSDFRDDPDGLCDANCDKNIYLYDFGPDGVFGTADDIGPQALTQAPMEQTSPVIFGTRVVWRDAREGQYLDPDLWTLDLGPDGLFGTADDEPAHRIDVPTLEPDNLDLDGDLLVFEDFRQGSWEVWLYDFSISSELQITDSPGGQFYPEIHGNLIVWQDARNNAPGTYDAMDDIYGYLLP